MSLTIQIFMFIIILSASAIISYELYAHKRDYAVHCGTENSALQLRFQQALDANQFAQIRSKTITNRELLMSKYPFLAQHYIASIF